MLDDVSLGETQEFIKTKSVSVIKHCIDMMFDRQWYDESTGYIRFPLVFIHNTHYKLSEEINILDLDDTSLSLLLRAGGGDIAALITDNCIQTELHNSKLIYAFLVCYGINEVRLSDFSCKIPAVALAYYVWEAFPSYFPNPLAKDIFECLPKLSNEDRVIYRDTIIEKHTKTLDKTSTAVYTVSSLINIVHPVWDDVIDEFVSDLAKDAKNISFLDINSLFPLIPDSNTMTVLMEAFFLNNWNRETISSIDEGILEHFKVLYRTNIVIKGPPEIEVEIAL